MEWLDARRMLKAAKLVLTAHSRLYVWLSGMYNLCENEYGCFWGLERIISHKMLSLWKCEGEPINLNIFKSNQRNIVFFVSLGFHQGGASWCHAYSSAPPCYDHMCQPQVSFKEAKRGLFHSFVVTFNSYHKKIAFKFSDLLYQGFVIFS